MRHGSTVCAVSISEEVVGRTRRQTRVDIVRGLLVAPEPHDRELGLDHARLDLAHADVGVDELAEERAVEGRHGGFGRAVDAACESAQRISLQLMG